MSQIKDPGLAEKGKMSYEWARDHMKILTNTVERLKKSQPLKGVRLGVCLHITKETSVLIMGAKALGADVSACGANPLSTQDDIAAFLADNGIHIYAWEGQTPEEYDWCIEQMLSHKPNVLTDDGSDCHSKIHGKKEFSTWPILGGTEETTTGVIRLKALEKQKKLKYPVIAVNDAYTKHMFDNRYGTGQSTIDGYFRSMNLLFAGKRVVVAGYGWVGRGVASRSHGLGAKVYVTEIDPVRALEAHMDGYEVMPIEEAAKVGDVFITATGQTGVIRKEHILKMKDGAVLGNVGHFDVEVDAKFLLNESKSVREVRPNLDECMLKNGKRVYLIGKGRIANLVAAEGHPPEVMAQSFSNQLLSMIYIKKNHKKIGKKVITVPQEIDKQIAIDALAAMSVKIDKPTAAQIKYAQSWA
ncbi:MAG TPA: adenosylhomocysteinase [Candidatus Nitrosotalea sp.]|nr:adenosylhomocysteinase [Nitrososphaerota archaeon]HKU33569.1 adenosylhomocysteinase [Candidatus Nitrosotalea sp.]